MLASGRRHRATRLDQAMQVDGITDLLADDHTLCLPGRLGAHLVKTFDGIECDVRSEHNARMASDSIMVQGFILKYVQSGSSYLSRIEGHLQVVEINTWTARCIHDIRVFGQ